MHGISSNSSPYHPTIHRNTTLPPLMLSFSASNVIFTSNSYYSLDHPLNQNIMGILPASTALIYTPMRGVQRCSSSHWSAQYRTIHSQRTILDSRKRKKTLVSYVSNSRLPSVPIATIVLYSLSISPMRGNTFSYREIGRAQGTRSFAFKGIIQRERREIRLSIQSRLKKKK